MNKHRGNLEKRRQPLANVEKGATVSTDELLSYDLLEGDGYGHSAVKHGQNEYAHYDYRSRKVHHTNHVESFWRLFKNSATSTHIHISEKYAAR